MTSLLRDLTSLGVPAMEDIDFFEWSNIFPVRFPSLRVGSGLNAFRNVLVLLSEPLPFWKRVTDVAIASVCLLLGAPLLMVVAIAVKLSSPGPVFFRQQRAGMHGKPFAFYKFRSMYVDAERRKRELWKYNERTGPVFKMRNDPRVTRVGRFLRRWSLDELPQLFNVLVGDMSLVGPRPPTLDEVEKYREWQHTRLDVMPGITCLWQIRARHECSFEDWVRLDIRYIRRRSVLVDLQILLLTIPAVLSRKGAC